VSGKQENNDADTEQKNRADFHTEPECVFYAAVLVSAKGKGAYWLEALAKSDYSGV